MEKYAKAWAEDILIPTYEVGEPQKNPLFLEKRVYQGSSGVVFPHPVIEKVSNKKSDKRYKAVFLENPYLRIMVLPELGGRIQMAYDKTRQRHFIYYNQVIKPALVGLTGPWISGGIEFNWPQHHRPSTFEAIDHSIVENEDGSVSVWVNEVERMTRTKGMAGFTLYPDKAYLEIKGKIYNRTPFPQTFLWWANPAVKVNDRYQSVFPPDVYAVFDHGRRDVSSFPIAKGVYYKVDYSPGTDISRYRNIPVPTSYMAIRSRYNFIGGYEHDTRGGLLHIADHHISPGKKQWTWGNGEFGRAWDKNLTDEDGPYIELMAGVYTDNQPDFSWLQPYEEKSFVQYFMPYSEVGMVKNATVDAVLNVEWEKDKEVVIRLYTTSVFERLQVLLLWRGVELFKEQTAVTPGKAYLKKILLEHSVDPGEVEIAVADLDSGRIIVAYRPEQPGENGLPSAAEAAKMPEELESTEQLYLTGLHLEQYRHATYIASDYYEAALKRDPWDVRNNNAMGLWWMRKGKFRKAEPYFRKAISTLTRRNPNPYDGEPYYNLGCALKMQGNEQEAKECFYKCVWNDAWQHAGYLNLARIDIRSGQYTEALEHVDKALIKNSHSHTARHLRVLLLRRLGMTKEAFSYIGDSLRIDPFNFGCLFEKSLLEKGGGEEEQAGMTIDLLCQSAHRWVHNFIEYAFDYAHAGQYKEAGELLLLNTEERGRPYPMAFYYLGWFAYCEGEKGRAKEYFDYAASLDPTLCFSNRIEDVSVLQRALEINPQDARALYYLGNFWYDKRQYADAIACWEQSMECDGGFPTVLRNLSLASYNKLKDAGRALGLLEKAFGLDSSDARVLMELDQLRKRLNVASSDRLSMLEHYLPLVQSRDDLYLERITLYNQLNGYNEARALIAAYSFSPWEGGEGKVAAQYHICHLELAKQAILEGEYQKAIALLNESENYPDNLGEGKLYGIRTNDTDYFKGLAYELSGEGKQALEYYRLATEGTDTPVQAVFYNDPQPDKIFYQGLAWARLGEQERANTVFTRLIASADRHINDRISIDYFAVSLPDLLVFDVDLDRRNKIHCLYLSGLGYLGLGSINLATAEKYFSEISAMDVNHQGAIIHTRMVEFLGRTGIAVNLNS